MAPAKSFPSLAWRLVVEAACGAAAFLAIAAIAVGINFLVVFLEGHKVDLLIVLGLKAAEYLLFFVDVLLFFRLIYRATLRAWQNM